MRLLITLDFPPEKGGIQQYLFGIVKHRYSPEDCVLAGGAPKQCALWNELPCVIQGVPAPMFIRNKKASIPILSILYLLKCISSRSPIDVECGNIYAAIVPWMLKVAVRKNYSIYTYGTELLRLRRKDFMAFLLRKVLLERRKCMCLEIIDTSLSTLGIDKHTIKIPPKIENKEYVVKDPSLSGSTLHVLTVGRLVPHKGHEMLVRAMSILSANRKTECAIVGSGPQEQPLKLLCRGLGLADVVRIRSSLSDPQLEHEFTKCDIFVLPSLETDDGTEGFGIVLLEAMAHGVPVIGSRTGGIPEVLKEGECGLLVTPGDPEVLADAILQLWKDPPLRVMLAQRARDRLHKEYVW